MTITPDQADRLKQGVTKTPWRAIKRDWEIHPTGIVRDADDETIGAAEGGHVDPEFTHGQADLIAAAPDMAETIAGMKYEHAVEIYHEVAGVWIRYGNWVEVQEVAELDLSGDDRTRLVRRLVSDPEVIDGE